MRTSSLTAYLKRRNIKAAVLIVVLVIVGVTVLVISRAAVVSPSLQPEQGTKNGAVVVGNTNTASENAYLRFGKGIPYGGASPGGTYADWYFSAPGLDSIEWTQHVVEDPPASLTSDNLLHYYAYTFGVLNHTNDVGYGYAGFQTNGLFQGIFRGKVINFSFWRNSGGKTSSPGLLNPANEESGGYQIMYPYNWIVGRQYRFQLKPGPSGVDTTGKWWGLWVTDLTTNSTTYIGEERLPTTINGNNSAVLNPRTGAFGEDLHWWRSLSGSTKYSCSDFQKSSMATRGVTANNGSLRPSSFTAHTNSLDPSTDPNNGYQTTNCPVSVYSNSTKDVQMNLGYWLPGAPDVIVSAP